MLSRKQIIDNIEALDAEIDALQESKRETYADHRAALVDEAGKDKARDEIEALKKAVQRRRQIAKHGVEVVEEKDALVEEILSEVEAATRAPRATPAIAQSVPTDHEPATHAADEGGGDDTNVHVAPANHNFTQVPVLGEINR